jgi:hypothetical protein
MPFHEIDQRTTEWHTLRLGKPTASCFKNLMTKDKSRFQDRKGEWLEVMWHWPQMPKSYAARLVAERIIGEPQDGLYAPEDEEDPFGESEDNNLPAAVARGRRNPRVLRHNGP